MLILQPMHEEEKDSRSSYHSVKDGTKTSCRNGEELKAGETIDRQMA
uniref:Uncharacterized protein n=1 Tax=Arundo donax TaxID=35708 RepID=A0A0A9AX79_ARUDO